jgi:hypothetical protein
VLPAASGGVQGRRVSHHRWVGLAYERKQFGVEVEGTYRDHIDDRNRDVVSEQRGALGHESAAGLGPVFVGGADNFDSGHQPAFVLRVVDAHLVFILVRRVRGDFQCRLRRRPDRRGHTAFFFADGRRIPHWLLLFEGCDIDFRIGPQMDTRPGHVTERQLEGQGNDHHGRPLTV